MNEDITWETAVRVYMGSLESKTSSEDNKKLAREEIIRLARVTDRFIADTKQE